MNESIEEKKMVAPEKGANSQSLKEDLRILNRVPFIQDVNNP